MNSLLALLAAVVPANIQFDVQPDGAQIIRVSGGATGTVSVYIDAADRTLPAIAGAIKSAGGDLIFVPRYPFVPGQAYRVEFDGGQKVSQVLMAEGIRAEEHNFVRHVYPTRNRLPANQLKFYFQFSGPMARGDAYRHIQLLDANNRVIEDAFLELNEELWDGAQSRFTLLFDPGRVKRDLVPNKDEGAPLKPGYRYSLKISASWPDANGIALKTDYVKHFEVVSDDRTAPDPKHWRLSPPRADSVDPLSIQFHESMDYGLLLHALNVADSRGKTIAGTVQVDEEETRWRFIPNESWTPGEFNVIVENSLEDLAGNRIGRLFDVDTRAPTHTAGRTGSKITRLPFSVPARD